MVLLPKLDSDNFVDLSLNHGGQIRKKLIEDGFCTIVPSPGDTVLVHYVGTYHGGEQHGRQFDSSRCRSEPLEFVIGKGQVIEAFSQCVATMTLGETCELITTAEYGFPLDQALKFTIELLDVRGQQVSLIAMDSVLMTVVEEGHGDLVPLPGCEVQIAYRPLRCRPAEPFRKVSFIVGQGSDAGVPECLDRAVHRMKRGGCALVRQYDCGDVTVKNTIRNELAMYEIQLISFDETTSTRPFETEFAQATDLKSSANEYFKMGDYSTAISMYEGLGERIQQLVTTTLNSESESVVLKLQTDVRLNLALAYLKVDRPTDCAELCRKVLDVDSSNPKALFRLGQALLSKNSPNEAEHWFKRLLVIDPNNAAALGQLRKCEALIKADGR